MASINISEADYGVLFSAAHDAAAHGDQDQAAALDKLARKVNAALTTNSSGRKLAGAMGLSLKSVRWEEMPSVFAEVFPPTPSREAGDVG